MLDISGIKRLQFDVLVIGAGGAGLSAAIAASQEENIRVGLVCKSLLGKAHTVMAEGGMAAALANVDDRDDWKIHFRDTMRGGKMLNNWKMAEIHAKNAPARVRELEHWGAVFDRTKHGLINQRNFGGHRYPQVAIRAIILCIIYIKIRYFSSTKRKRKYVLTNASSSRFRRQ